MKNRIISLILSIVMVVSMLPVYASAEDITTMDSGTCSDNLTWVLTKDGVLTISGTGTMNDFVWGDPKYDVPWTSYKNFITSVVIEDGVTSIGASAFNEFSALTSVTIPDSVTTIGDHAFHCCTALNDVIIPDYVTTIDQYAFDGCVDLTNVSIGDSVTTIGKHAFGECDVLTSVTIPASVTSIGQYAFDSCASLTEIVVDAENTAYSNDQHGVLFNKDKTELIAYPGGRSGEYTIPDTATHIADGAFFDCDALTCVSIGDSVTSIGEFAFACCDALNSVTIGDLVTAIGDYAFRSCEALTSVIIGDSVTTIGIEAFAFCTALGEIYFEGDAHIFGDAVFYYVTATAYYPADNTTWTETFFRHYDGTITWVPYSEEPAYSEGLTYTLSSDGTYYTVTGIGTCQDLDIIIPATHEGLPVKEISGSAFYNCDALTSVTIPDSVTTIGSSAFKNCTALTDVNIPNSVNTIGYGAFANCAALPSVTIPDSVITISYGVFEDCVSLTSVIIGDFITTIDVGAFANCSSLTDITIPQNVTTINDRTFANCSSLTSITIPEGVTTIGACAFYNCSSLKSIAIPDSVTTIGLDTFADCSSLTSVAIGNGVTTIGSGAFAGCSSLTSVKIGASVTTIGGDAFANCSSLTDVYITDVAAWLNIAFDGYSANPLRVNSKEKKLCLNDELVTELVIPEGVTTISEYAFMLCSNLTSITIPDSVTTIDVAAFYECNSLANVNIPDSVTTIARAAFYNCDSLTSVTIGDSVTTIGDDAFKNCDALTSVTIGDSVTSIGDNVFWNCTALTQITFEGDAPSFGSHVFLGATATAYYPEGNDTWTDAVKRNYGGTITWVAYGEEPAYSEGLEYTLSSDGTCYIVSGIGTCQDLDIIIPATHEGLPVKEIGAEAFENNDSLIRVTIPDTVTTIGDGAFYHCTGLANVTIGNSVTTIGSAAFKYCTGLVNVTIPNSVTTIGERAFADCYALTGVTIPDFVTTIGSAAFEYCDALTSVTIGNSVITIDYAAFRGCDALTSVIIPDSVTSIGNYAFAYCDVLEAITFTGDAPSFGENVFYNVTATAYYPAGNETWTEDVRQNYGGTITWVPYGEEVCQHTETAVSGAVPATCTAPGYTGDTVCASCGELLAQGEEIPQLEHDYTETVTAPTCAAAGYTLHTCSLCGDSYISDYTEALGHNYQNTASLAPTCTAAGYDIYGCRNDGCDSEKKYIIPATGHQFGDDNVCDVCGFTVPEDHTHTCTSVVVLPTCTTAGYTEHTCDCGHSYQTDLMEPTGHHWDEGTVTVAPTCTEDGLLVYACVNCDAVITELLPAAHRWSTTVTKEPTCTEDGSATRVCESCGLEETVVLPAGHSWDEGVITKAPTCTEDGTKTVTCTVCGAAEVQPVEKLGHHFVNGVCTRCGSGIFDIVTPSNHHLQYGMYFDVDDVVSNYGPDLINEYGVYLDYNKDADIRRVGIYLTQEGNLWRRCIACVGEGITSATYVPYLSYGSDIKYTGLNNDGINVFPLSKNADGIWCYNDYATIGVNLEDRYGNLLLSLYDIGQSGARTRIFTDLDEMIRWLQEDIEAMCNDVGYPTVEEALAAAKSGDVVTLVDDAEVDVLLIPAGVTLDLDIYDLHAKGVLGITGSKLTAAEYSVGSDWGKLYVQGPEYLVLSGCVENNNGKEVGLLPVWDGDQGCYVMGGALYNTDNYTLTTDESTISFLFAPSLRGDLRKALFTDEGEMSDNGLSIVLRLTWHSGDGLAQQDFVYSSEFVSKFCKSGSGLFTFTLTGYEAMYIELEDLTITPMIVCDNGLTFCGQTVTGV